MKRRRATPIIQAIGVIRSCFREKFGTPRQPGIVPAARSWLKIFPRFSPRHSLRELEGFSHVWILSYFHLNTNKKFLPTVHPPRLAGKAVGLFASRSPHRPSPLGLSLARLEKIDGDTLYFSGVDLVDGTPVLDIKPHIPAYDRAPGARSGWSASVQSRTLTVAFEPRARDQAKAFEKSGRAGLTVLIRQTLRQDLRNPRDRSQFNPAKIHEMRLLDLLIRFFISNRRATVSEIGIAPAKSYARPGRIPPQILRIPRAPHETTTHFIATSL
ncbi:MAG: tRNA (N6-threonylcarbamoyladenosine(37)-N6)-methyltransferase TrmO [Elusimicrobiota bacterium]